MRTRGTGGNRLCALGGVCLPEALSPDKPELGLPWEDRGKEGVEKGERGGADLGQ